jgi:hypothetical protein
MPHPFHSIHTPTPYCQYTDGIRGGGGFIISLPLPKTGTCGTRLVYGLPFLYLVKGKGLVFAAAAGWKEGEGGIMGWDVMR